MSLLEKPTRREVLATAAAMGAAGMLSAQPAAAAGDDAIRPFHISNELSCIRAEALHVATLSFIENSIKRQR